MFITFHNEFSILQDEAREAELKERVYQMLISGQPETASTTGKKIVKTGGVRVLGRAPPKPQIHIVQNTTMTQQQKMSDVDSDSTQVSDKPNQDSINNTHSKDVIEDNGGKETDKESDKEHNKEFSKEEDDKPQKTAQPKRKKRHHVAPEVKPVSREPSASALSMASQPPVDKPTYVPRTTPTTVPIAKTVSKEENLDNNVTTDVQDLHDEVSTTPPPSSDVQSPDSTQVSLMIHNFKKLCNFHF